MNQISSAFVRSDLPEDAAGAPAPSGTYVMQGQESEKALNTYHLILAPTHACNLRCKHCYLPDHATDLLPREVALRLIDEWAEITLADRGPFRGIFHVKGGEPFVVPYLSDLMERLVELKCLRFMLTTNGTHTKPRHLALLTRAHKGLDGHLTVVVSLDGATAETHDLLRGEGQFKRTAAFLGYLRDAGIHTFLNCVLHSRNLHQIPHYVHLAKEYCASQINFLALIPKGFGKSLRCHQERHTDLHDALQTLYRESDDSTKKLMAGSLPDIVRRELRGDLVASHECVAGYRGLLYIKPDGFAFSCPNLVASEYSLGNVATTSLAALMENLHNLYQQLSAGRGSDRYLCTGERLQYEADKDPENLRSLRELQNAAKPTDVNHSSITEVPRIAFCVSRNW